MSEVGVSRESLALARLHEVITSVHSMDDLQGVLEATAQSVVDVLGFGVAVVDVVNEDGFVQALAVAGDEKVKAVMAGRRNPIVEVLAEFEIADDWGRLRFVPHERLTPDANSSWVPEIEPLDVEDAWHPLDTLYAPLHGPMGELLGLLSVDLPDDGRRPGALARQVLEMFAVQAGLAIHHAQERGRLRERVLLSQTVHRVVEATSRDLNLGNFLEASLEPIASGFRCSGLAVRVFDRLGSTHTMDLEREQIAGAGETWPPDMFDGLADRLAALDPPVSAADLLSWGERIARTAWPRGMTVMQDLLHTPPEDVMSPAEVAATRGMLSVFNADSYMIVPLGSGPDCVGYLSMMRGREAGPWSEIESDAALEVGREMGRVVHRTHLYLRERELVAELQELNRHKGEMIATITHELKNPLTSIRGHVGLLATEGAASRSVDAIERNVQRLVTLIDDLLTLAKVSDPDRELTRVPVDLVAVVAEVCDGLAVQADLKGVVLVRPVRVSPLTTHGEAEELTRLVTNIVSNAIKYTARGGTATLELAAVDGRVRFTCTDTGLGISAGDLVHLFDEFDRSSNPAARSERGSGLGLAIVRRIADRHDGKLIVESELGVGSTFGVSLPAEELAP